jgi:hypothetical protein
LLSSSQVFTNVHTLSQMSSRCYSNVTSPFTYQIGFHLDIKSWGVRLVWIDIGGSDGWMYFILCHPSGTLEVRFCQSLTYAQQKN